jgi:ABC-type nitrate/sulfonate/bicarbonate transport system substrate-binding protein
MLAGRILLRYMASVLLASAILGVTLDDANPREVRFTVRFGVVGTVAPMYYAPLVVAQQKAFFEQEGVQINRTVIGPDDNLVRAVAGRALDMGIPEASIAINAAAHGAPVKVVAALTDRYPYELFVAKGVKAYSDLQGKTISHWTVAPEVSVALIRRLLAAHGLQEVQYNLIAGGNLTARYAALSQGAVAGAILTAPFDILARKNGFNELGGLYEFPAVFASVVVNAPWASSHPNVVVAVLKAMVLGFRYASNPAHRDEVVRIMAEVGKVDPAAIAPTWDEFYREQTYLTSWDLIPSQRSMQGVVDVLASLGQVPKGVNPLTYFDLSYLNQAINQLRK